MKYPKLFALILAICINVLSIGTVSAQPALTLDQILTRIEEKGTDLRAMKAQLSQKKWTEVLQEFDEGESGRFYFLREKGSVFLKKEISQPQPSQLVINEGQVTFYQPSLKQAQKYNLGGNKDKAEFLLIGFGTSREALNEAYKVRLIGREKLDGKEYYSLELLPRSNQVSAYFAKIVLWIDPIKWVPVQQQLWEPTGDYLIVRFDQIELNPRLSKSEFELKLPKDVKILGS